MKITLRKANAVQTSMFDVIKSIKVAPTVELDEFSNPEDMIAQARETLIKNDQRRAELLSAHYSIRELVSQANSLSGISALLTKAAYIDKRLAQLQEIASSAAMPNLNVIKGRVEKLKAVPDSRSAIYGRPDTVSTSVLLQEQIDQTKKEIANLKKQKQKINDQVLELNIKTEIALDDTIASLLDRENLI